MDPKVKLALDYLALGSAIFGSPWIGAIAKLFTNRELTFELNEVQREQILSNLAEKYQWRDEDSVSNSPLEP